MANDETHEVFNDKSLDQTTPIGVLLTAKYKRSFAYSTIRDRLPVIIAKVVDYLCRDKLRIAEQFGDNASEEIKSIIGSFSKLRNELQTNKPLLPISTGADAVLWNESIENARWFDSPWLLVECYLYRRMRDNIAQSGTMSSFDQFLEQKQNGFMASMTAMKSLEVHVLNTTCETEAGHTEELKSDLFDFFKVSLWGNKCDMSLSGGEVRNQGAHPIKQLASLDDKILDSHLEQVWNKLQSLQSATIDIVLDNAGFELFTDLCLADFLVSHNLAQTVRFHAKTMPWFVSDTTPLDIFWSLEQVEHQMPALGSRWRDYFNTGRWILHPSHKSSFWTLPFAFNKMKEIDPELFALLNSSGLTIYKGDLNYRKLVGDVNWNPNTTPAEAFQGCPAPLLTLRTLKADVVIGLDDTTVARMTDDWMVSGEYAVIQFLDK